MAHIAQMKDFKFPEMGNLNMRSSNYHPARPPQDDSNFESRKRLFAI